MWGATIGNDLFAVVSQFQSTHPCGVRQVCLRGLADFKVSIHAPVWGATIRNFKRFGSFNVSIHAPVWGATKKDGIQIIPISVSIHAPVWGATRHLALSTRMASFNPRTRVGCDRSASRACCNFSFQSTHPCGVRRHFSYCKFFAC